MHSTWVNSARRTLLEWRGTAPGWPYRKGGGPFVEPTALAILALSAHNTSDDEARTARLSAGGWLASLQQADGALGLSSELTGPHWTTALAILAWCACEDFAPQIDRAAGWLRTHRGETVAPSAGTPFAHDTTIPGWSWVAGTHSWLEPTALAVLALARAGEVDSIHLRDGRRLIQDRAIRGGGWNYGNSRVFDTDLRPQPAPTGLALLALAGADRFDEPRIGRGCESLEVTLPGTQAAQSLCWGLLGLTAWNTRPAAADGWLAAALERVPRRSDRALQLAYLLLAAGDRAVSLFVPEPAVREAVS